MGPLDKLDLERILDKYRANPISRPRLKVIEDLRDESNYLSRPLTKASLPLFSVAPETWSTFYPKLGHRIMAYLFYKIVGKTEYATQHWLHTVFPFTVSYSIRENESLFDLPSFDELNLDLYNYIVDAASEERVPFYIARLEVPRADILS